MTAFSRTSIALLVLSILAAAVDITAAFSVIPIAPSTSTRTTSRLYFFGGLGDAFKNDDSLGKAKDSGLTNGPKYNDQVTVNGKAVTGAVAGQKLTVVAGRARVKIPVNCQKGDCGTCMVKLNGRQVKACQVGLPTGKAVIQTL